MQNAKHEQITICEQISSHQTQHSSKQLQHILSHVFLQCLIKLTWYINYPSLECYKYFMEIVQLHLPFRTNEIGHILIVNYSVITTALGHNDAL